MRIKAYQKGAKAQLTANFNSDEFDCKCQNAGCATTLIDLDHVELLQNLRAELGFALTINSAYRCQFHNKAIGGSPKSRHREGDATDISTANMPISQEDFLEKVQHFNGVGTYSNFIHLDSRGYMSRWDLRSKK